MSARAADAEPRVHRADSSGVRLTVEEHGRPGPGRALLFLPALGVPLSYYRPLFEHWTARGRHLFGVEWRGMPQSPVASLRREPFGYSHLVRHDLPAVHRLDAVASAGELVLVGHSLGGHVALLSTAAGLVAPSAVVTIATGTSSGASQASHWGRVRRRIGTQFVRTASDVLGYWPGHRLGFGGRQPKPMMHDFAYEARHGRYRLTGDPTDYEAALATLDQPALLLALAGDPLMPLLGVDHLAGRLPTHVHRAGVDTGLAGDHFAWARKAPEPVVSTIETWLAANAP